MKKLTQNQIGGKENIQVGGNLIVNNNNITIEELSLKINYFSEYLPVDLNTESRHYSIQDKISYRLRNIETRRQINIEAIVNKAIGQLKTSIDTIEKPDPDWIADFFNISQDISDKKLQNIWAKILANEVDLPGSISRRTLHIVKIISSKEAIFFNLFCEHTISVLYEDDSYNTYGMLIMPENGHFLLNDEYWDIKSKNIGILQELRLCEFSELLLEKNETYTIKIGKKKYKVNLSEDITLHMHCLSQTGLDLMQLIAINSNIEYMQASEKYLTKIGLINKNES